MGKNYETAQLKIFQIEKEDVVLASGTGETMVSDRAWDDNPWGMEVNGNET